MTLIAKIAKFSTRN